MKSRFTPTYVLLLAMLVLTLAACQRRAPYYANNVRPKKTLTKYFDEKYMLYKLPSTYYNNDTLEQTFAGNKTKLNYYGVDIDFSPMGYADSLHLQYTHVYSSKCVYHTADTIWKYAEVMFPNTCLTNDLVYSKIHLHNTETTTKTINLRLFYQNTTYWYPSNDLSLAEKTLDNYYGKSDIVQINLAANADTIVQLGYSIRFNAKGEFWDNDKAPVRPGNYEFMLVADTSSMGIMHPKTDIEFINPFTEVVKNKQSNYAYVGPQHFKFVFLDEYFDGTNDLDPNHAYIAKYDGSEKKLCDTCSGWYKGVISENWSVDDFFKGHINNAGYVKADYGIRKNLTRIDKDGITLTMPASTKGNYKKTWGEVLFGQAFKYGHVTVRAKFAPMYGQGGTPNGIVHNLWLYERDGKDPDPNNPYNHLRNGAGKQPYEIDFEIWSSMEGVNSQWDNKAFINYSIVDYMRDTSVTLKPGEFKEMGRYKAERLNNRQAGIPGNPLPPQFFESFHIYELYWYPDHVRFLLDGKEVGLITKDMADIPDTHMFLWIGSPIYQDGTYFSQSQIPFLETEKQTIIDYIRID
ncbi:MAG: family 16 glycosylhydrolase [Bacteroidetes bacterium]|nr:family 16 glycosylhydrolase [Bacteroidota bacterium]